MSFSMRIGEINWISALCAEIVNNVLLPTSLAVSALNFASQAQ
jgi:hypothetical protein